MRYIPILEILGSVLALAVLAEWIYHSGIVKKRTGIVIVLSLLCQISIATGFFLDDIQCFVVPDPSGSLAAELKGDVPIIGINSYFATTNEYTSQVLEQRLKDFSELNIYSVTNRDGGWIISGYLAVVDWDWKKL